MLGSTSRTTDFKSVLSLLWDELALPKSDFDGETQVTLHVDAADIIFREAQDRQTLSIEMRVGRLTSHPALLRRELEKLLKTCFVIAAARNTIVVLVGGAQGLQRSLWVKAYYRYQCHDMARLLSLVADVVSSAETLQQIVHEFDRGQNGIRYDVVEKNHFVGDVCNCVILKP